MGEKILSHHLAAAGLDDIEVTSCGTGGWHIGDPADPRARKELAAHGYASDHIAAKFGDRDADADLYLAMDSSHADALRRLGVPEEKVRMLRSYDPAATDLDVADPYYGSAADFVRVREQIEAAIPALVGELSGRQG